MSSLKMTIKKPFYNGKCAYAGLQITYSDYLVILTICYFLCLLFVRCIEERREKVCKVSIQYFFVPVEKAREKNVATCLDINHL